MNEDVRAGKEENFGEKVGETASVDASWAEAMKYDEAEIVSIRLNGQ